MSPELPTKVVSAAAGNILDQGVLGALVAVFLVAILVLVWLLHKTQEARVADQKQLVDKSDQLFKQTLAVQQETQIQSAKLLQNLAGAKEAMQDLEEQLHNGSQQVTVALARLEQNVERVEQGLKHLQGIVDADRTSSVPNHHAARPANPGHYSGGRGGL